MKAEETYGIGGYQCKLGLFSTSHPPSDKSSTRRRQWDVRAAVWQPSASGSDQLRRDQCLDQFTELDSTSLMIVYQCCYLPLTMLWSCIRSEGHVAMWTDGDGAQTNATLTSDCHRTLSSPFVSYLRSLLLHSYSQWRTEIIQIAGAIATEGRTAVHSPRIRKMSCPRP